MNNENQKTERQIKKEREQRIKNELRTILRIINPNAITLANPDDTNSRDTGKNS